MTNRLGLAITCGVAGIFFTAALIAVSTRSDAVSSGTVQYRYDSLGRVVQDSYPANAATYTYDKAGNRTNATVQ
jgi:hypothetical protein